MEIITRAEAKAQGLTRYFTGKPCKHGNLHERSVGCKYCLCRDCRDERNGRSRVWRAKNPDRQAESCRNWQLNNWEKQQEVWRRAEEAKKQRADEDPDYKQRRREQATSRMLKRHRRLYKTDPSFTFQLRIKVRVLQALKATASGKAGRTEAMLGCSWTEAVNYFAALFADGMNWENMGAWHVDHKRPCASFDLTDPQQQLACWNWRNLQPLWAADNLAKSDEWTPAMEAEWATMMRESGFEGELFLVFGQNQAAA